MSGIHLTNLNIDIPCLQSHPCKHYCSVQLSDGSESDSKLLKGDQILALIQNIGEAKVTYFWKNGQKLQLKECYEHFRDYKADIEKIRHVFDSKVVFVRNKHFFNYLSENPISEKAKAWKKESKILNENYQNLRLKCKELDDLNKQFIKVRFGISKLKLSTVDHHSLLMSKYKELEEAMDKGGYVYSPAYKILIQAGKNINRLAYRNMKDIVMKELRTIEKTVGKYTCLIAQAYKKIDINIESLSTLKMFALLDLENSAKKLDKDKKSQFNNEFSNELKALSSDIVTIQKTLPIIKEYRDELKNGFARLLRFNKVGSRVSAINSKLRELIAVRNNFC